MHLTPPSTSTCPFSFPSACHQSQNSNLLEIRKCGCSVFLQGVVLDAVREDIRENGKLSPHYYEALKRALYKPGAFFKGIVFPLLEVSSPIPATRPILSLMRFFQSGCTLKEAAIVASVLAKVKVPLVHSAAAIIHLANMDYSG